MVLTWLERCAIDGVLAPAQNEVHCVFGGSGNRRHHRTSYGNDRGFAQGLAYRNVVRNLQLTGCLLPHAAHETWKLIAWLIFT